MSAAAARRRKQLRQKQEAILTEESNGDPVLHRLNSLLSPEMPTEDAAYEALQLAQSQVRRSIKLADYPQAIDMAYKVSVTLLEKKKVSVASQLLAILAEACVETQTDCTEEMVERVTKIDTLYRSALGPKSDSNDHEFDRLSRLHAVFLRKIVRWSAEFGSIRYGDVKLHSLLGEQCWSMSFDVEHDTEYDEELGPPPMELRAEGITHMALAEQPERILELLKTLKAPTKHEEKTGRNGTNAAERDCLLTRAVLVMIAVENLRDGNALLRSFTEFDTRDMGALAKSYMNKKDGKAPTHVIFCSMLLQICEKDRAGPLFQWALKSFSKDLDKMKPEVKSYTSKIGRVYFNIQPPPSMMNMMENMMSMMGGGMMPPGMMPK